MTSTADAPTGSRAGSRAGPRTGRASKRAAVLRAATETFLRDGFRGASMDDISRRAGVSKATVYAYYATKADLFGAMVENLRGQVDLPLEEGHAAARSPRRALTDFALAHLALLQSEPVLSLQRLLFAEARRTPDLAAAFFRSGPAKVLERLARFLEREHRAGRMGVADPVRAAEQFMGLLMGPTHFRRLLGLEKPGTPAERRRHVDDAVTTFLARYGI